MSQETKSKIDYIKSGDKEAHLKKWGISSWIIIVGFGLGIFLGFGNSSANLQMDPRLLAAIGLTLIWHGARGIAGETKRLYLFGIPAYLISILLAFYLTIPVNLLIAATGVLGLYFAWKAYQAPEQSD